MLAGKRFDAPMAHPCELANIVTLPEPIRISGASVLAGKRFDAPMAHPCERANNLTLPEAIRISGRTL